MDVPAKLSKAIVRLQNGPGCPRMAALPLCEQCSNDAARYKCPGCGRRTCSLACSNAHKAAQSCSGERDKTAYVSREQYGYLALMEDYRFLEDLSRKFEASKKDAPRPAKRRKIAKRGKETVVNDPLLPLKKAAMGSGVSLVLLAEGMERRRTNKTRLVRKGRESHIEWQISWNFRCDASGKPPSAKPAVTARTAKNTSSSPIPELLLRFSLNNKLPDAAKAMLSSSELMAALASAARAMSPMSLVFLLPVPSLAEGPGRSAQTVLERIEKRPAPTPAVNNTREPLPQFKRKMIGSLMPHSSLPAKPGVHLPGGSFFPSSNGQTVQTQPSAPAKPEQPKARLAPAKRYWQLSSSQSLERALAGCTVVEWPEIEIWYYKDLQWAQRNGYIEVVRRMQDESVSTPQRPPTPAAVKVKEESLSGLAGYGGGSDSDEAEEGEVADARDWSTLAGLLKTEA